MATRKARTEVPAPYLVTRTAEDGDDAIIAAALAILTRRMTKRDGGDAVASPEAVRTFLRLRLAGEESEAFWCVFLNSQNRVIDCRELFRGTLSQTSVYPREVVKAALACNAGAVIFAHNHPSGVAQPSRADELLTQALKQALVLVDIRVLDHFIVAGVDLASFAERGLL